MCCWQPCTCAWHVWDVFGELKRLIETQTTFDSIVAKWPLLKFFNARVSGTNLGRNQHWVACTWSLKEKPNRKKEKVSPWLWMALGLFRCSSPFIRLADFLISKKSKQMDKIQHGIGVEVNSPGRQELRVCSTSIICCASASCNSDHHNNENSRTWSIFFDLMKIVGKRRIVLLV